MERHDRSVLFLKGASQQTTALYFPLVFTIGSHIHPTDYINYVGLPQARAGSSIPVPDLIHFHHELSHALLFLSTYYGAHVLSLVEDYKRLFVSCGGQLHRLTELEPLPPEFETIPSGAEIELMKRSLESSLRFLFSIDLSTSPMTAADLAKEALAFDGSLVSRPVRSGEAPLPDPEDALEFRGRCEHFYRSTTRAQHEVTRVNSGCLAEALAVLAEISFTEAAEGVGLDEAKFFDYVSSLPVAYRACFELLREELRVPYAALRPTLITLLDVSFMCGTCFTSWLTGAAEERAESLSPADVFLLACASLEKLQLPCELDDIPRFRADLYAALGFQQERKVFEVSTSTLLGYFDRIYDLTRADWRIETGLSLFAQVRAYQMFSSRRHEDWRQSVSAIVEPESALALLAMSGNAIHFYDSRDRKAIPFIRSITWNGSTPEFEQLESYEDASSDQSWGGALLGHALLDLARGVDLGCPLKRGIPYRCHSHGTQDGLVCTWTDSKPVGEAYHSDLLCPYASLKEEARRVSGYREEMSLREEVSEQEEREIWMRHFKDR